MGACLMGGLLVSCSGRLALDPSAYQSSVRADDAGAPWAVDAQPAPSSLPDAAVDRWGLSDVAPIRPAWTDAGADAWVAPADAWVAPADARTAPADSAPVTPVSACAPGVDGVALLAMKCGNCHGAHAPAKALDLASPGLASRLFNVGSGCMGRPLLDPSTAPVSGVLLDRMAGVSACGPQMPYGLPALTDAEQACIAEWAQKASVGR